MNTMRFRPSADLRMSELHGDTLQGRDVMGKPSTFQYATVTYLGTVFCI